MPDESLRDAIYRFSNKTKNPRAAKEYLVDEYRDQVNADDYNKKIQESFEIPSVDSRMAEMPDPETGEFTMNTSLDDPFRRAGLQLKKTVGGSLSTLGFQDTGIEMSQEAEERLKQIARPATRAEIEKEGGFWLQSMEDYQKDSWALENWLRGLFPQWHPMLSASLHICSAVQLLVSEQDTSHQIFR